MINFEEIQKGDLIKVNVIIDEVEDELFAKVSDNRGDHMEIHYFEETSLVYKDARVYSIESEMNLIRLENICEHYPGGETIFVEVSDNKYVLESELFFDDEDSNFYDDSDSDALSFVVSDGSCEPPPDHKDIDEKWTAWEPKSEGQKRFKQVVDDLDARMRHVNY